MQIEFSDRCYELRKLLKSCAVDVLELRGHPVFPTAMNDGRGPEMIANVMLAYRHLEDAAMRLGKAVQAFDGGKSVYDK